MRLLKNAQTYKGIIDMKKLMLSMIVICITLSGMEQKEKDLDYNEATFITYDNKEIIVDKSVVDHLPKLKELVNDIGADAPIPLPYAYATLKTLTILNDLISAMPQELFRITPDTSQLTISKESINTRIQVVSREIDRIKKQLGELERNGEEQNQLKNIGYTIRKTEQSLNEAVDENEKQALGLELQKLRDQKEKLDNKDAKIKKLYKTPREYYLNQILPEISKRKTILEKLTNEKTQLKKKLNKVEDKLEIKIIDPEIVEIIKEKIVEITPNTFLPCLNVILLSNYLGIKDEIFDELINYLGSLSMTDEDYTTLIKNNMTIPKQIMVSLIMNNVPQEYMLDKTLQGHQDWVWDIAFSPNSAQLASASRDKTIKLWNPNTGECTQTLLGHQNWVYSVAFSPDGAQLASASRDKTIKLWNPNTGECTQTLRDRKETLFSIAFSPDGAQLASASVDETIKLWNPNTGECTQTLLGHQNWVYSVAFSPDGAQLASASNDKTIKMWNTTTGECIQTLQGHTAAVWRVAFSPDGAQLASASVDKTIKLWNPNTGECTQTLLGHQNWVYSVAFSPDGAQLASASRDKTIKLWNPNTGECTQTLQNDKKRTMSVAFSPADAQLASGWEDGAIKLWKCPLSRSSNVLNDLNAHKRLFILYVLKNEGNIESFYRNTYQNLPENIGIHLPKPKYKNLVLLKAMKQIEEDLETIPENDTWKANPKYETSSPTLPEKNSLINAQRKAIKAYQPIYENLPGSKEHESIEAKRPTANVIKRSNKKRALQKVKAGSFADMYFKKQSRKYPDNKPLYRIKEEK
jgi:WD40 repeat protein